MNLITEFTRVLYLTYFHKNWHLQFKFTKTTQFDEIFQLIWGLLSKFQVNWEVLSKFCGLPKKSELYGEVWMREYDF